MKIRCNSFTEFYGGFASGAIGSQIYAGQANGIVWTATSSAFATFSNVEVKVNGALWITGYYIASSSEKLR
jgi:hypothetical protein